jgi:hypothetical protein
MSVREILRRPKQGWVLQYILKKYDRDPVSRRNKFMCRTSPSLQCIALHIDRIKDRDKIHDIRACRANAKGDDIFQKRYYVLTTPRLISVLLVCKRNAHPFISGRRCCCRLTYRRRFPPCQRYSRRQLQHLHFRTSRHPP